MTWRTKGCFVHAFALFLMAGTACAATAEGGAALRAGAAAVDITPTQFPLNMPGGFNENLAQRAHDPLYARALVLDDGATQIAMVVVDNIGVASDVILEAKAIAAQRTGIPLERMLVSSTHTHSAPPPNIKDGPAPAVAYRKLLVEGIAKAVIQAHAARRPAAVGTAIHPLPDEVFNRRWFLKPGHMTPNPFGLIDQVKMNPPTDPAVLDRPAGPTDPDITVLSIEDATSHKPHAVYANYSLHYVGGTPKGEVSADYYGEFARLMPSRVGGGRDFVAMMSNGTSGNINNISFGVKRPPRETFEQIRIVAQKAADTVWHARGKIASHDPNARLAMAQRNIAVHLRHPTADQIERAKAVLATTDPEEKAKLPKLAEYYAARTLELAKADETLTVPLQAIVVGDLAICAIPFETFVEIGLELKKKSPFPRTMVVGIANGYNGYLPTPEQHKLGGYETWLGSNRVREDTSTILTEQLLEMLGELSRQK